ncbi:MAG: hypothetical protein IT361_14730 [Gemmatimonadaceae bacterium]|nr:hypothetical protein [Gemmatimonadaceae bacterium]
MNRFRPLGLLAALAAVVAVVVLSRARAVSASDDADTAPQTRVPSALRSIDFGRPEAQVTLPKGLVEVSGLAVTANGSLLAHGDERGIVSVLDGLTGRVARWFSLGRPPVRADLEGIALVGPRLFLITSTGILYEAREGAAESEVAASVTDTGIGTQCEIEGLAWDARAQALLVPCKTPLVDAWRDRVTVFRWPLVRTAQASPPISVPLGAAIARTGTRGFRPSGIEVDPVTGNYVLVAGPERALLEIDPRGDVVGGVALSRKLHRQPEGIAFLGDSLLVIADEGSGSRATLTTYRRAR